MKRSIILFFSLNLSFCVCAQISDFANTDFRMADSIAAVYAGHSLGDIRGLSHKLTQKLPTSQEKFRAIYKWVCENIENDYFLYMKTTRQRAKLKSEEEFKAWNKKFNATVFKKLIEERKTICSGYAYLVRELALHAGLSCVIINGYGRTAVANVKGKGVPNHTWNAVQMDNKWYLCDATWSSGAINLQQSRFIPGFNEAYFLADPSIFIRNHYPLDSKWMLVHDDKPSLDVFLTRPVIYSPVYTLNITDLSPDILEASAVRGDKFSFQFKADGQSIRHAELQIRGPAGVITAVPTIYRSNSGHYCIDYIFTAKGKHHVHVLLENNYAFSYTIHVQ